MDETERHFWMAVAAISFLVFVLLVSGPVVKTYREWKTRRAFRQRRESYEKNEASRLRSSS